MKIGRVLDNPRDEPFEVLGETLHEVHVHLAICECGDCEVTEDISSLMALDYSVEEWNAILEG